MMERRGVRLVLPSRGGERRGVPEPRRQSGISKQAVHGVGMTACRPAHRPPKYPGEPMTTLTVRLPVRLKEKLVRLSDGRTGDWVCANIENTRESET